MILNKKQIDKKTARYSLSIHNSYFKIQPGSSRLLRRLSDNFLLEATVFEVCLL